MTTREPRTAAPGRARAGVVMLVLGSAAILAGCYRSAVVFSHGAVKPLVPIALDAPLAGEFLVLVGLVACALAALLLVASSRRKPARRERDPRTSAAHAPVSRSPEARIH